MRKLHILVEGPTEEAVVKNVIGPYLSNDELCVAASILTTKRPAEGPAHKGGVSSWTKLLKEIRLLLGDSSMTLLTTLIDYYAFPADAPGMASRPKGSPYDRVEHVERAVAEVVGAGRFLPHLVLHELETWVLADCQRLAELMGDQSGAKQLLRAVQQESSPEMINEGTDTAHRSASSPSILDTSKPATGQSLSPTQEWTPSGDAAPIQISGSRTSKLGCDLDLGAISSRCRATLVAWGK